VDDSTAPSTTAPTTTPTSGRPVGFEAVPGGVPLSGSPCRVRLPASWRRELASASLWQGATLPAISGVPVPGYPGVLVGRSDATAVHLDVRGRRAKRLGDLGAIRGGPGNGLAADSATGRHLAVIYQSTAGEAAQNRWTLYVWDRKTGLTRVASNPTDNAGNPLPGGYVHPFFAGDRYLYWIQAATVGTRNVAGSSLQQYDLTTGRTRTMFTGLVTAAVPYGNEVLLAGTPESAIDRVGNNRLNTTVHAVDQASADPMPTPAGLVLGHDGPQQMVTDGDLVAWDTNNAGIRAWRPEWRATRTLFPDYQHVPRNLAGINYPDNLGLGGHFLVWNGPRDWIMDLRTDSVTPISDRAGQVDLSGRRLMFWQDTAQPLAAGPTGPFTYSASLLDLEKLPDLPFCQ
jgi:hypothetical protein